MNFFWVLLIVLTVSFGATDVAAGFQQNANTVSGHVSDIQRTPIPNLRVELLNEVDSVIQTVKTDGSGLFIFRKLSDGTFQIRIQPAGTDYISQTKRVELSRPHGFGAAFEEVEFVLATKRDKSTNNATGVLFAQEVPEPARTHYLRASELIAKSEKRNEAFVLLKKAIEIFPTYFDALELLGSEYVKQGEYDSAVPVLTKAVMVNSRAFTSWYALGVAQFNLKQFSASTDALRRAVQINDNSINASLWLGMVMRQTSNLTEAETYLRKASMLADHKLPEAHWQLALLFNQLKRYKEAADELEIFLKVQPDSRDVEQIKKLIQRFRQQSNSTNNRP